LARYLVVLLWPAGIAAILVSALLRSRRPGPSAVAAGHPDRRPAPAGSPRPAAPTAPLRGAAVIVLGTLAVFGIMCLLGVLVVHQGPAIDRPVYHWMHGHTVRGWTAVNKRLTKIGDTWTTWGAAATAAVCLAVAGRRPWWQAPALFAAAIVVDHYTTLALRHVFHRIGPPDSPLGTFPSGGCDRVILFYGLIAYLLWREFSGSRRGAIWSAASVAALGFSEGYSRGYLTLHWLTDILSGLLYGGLLLAVFVAACRRAEDPAPQARGASGPRRALAPDRGPTG